MAAGQTQANADLTLDVSGEPSLTLSGEGDRLSGSAYAGKEMSVPLILRNTGTAVARDITLSASTPSDWKVTFQPARLDQLAAGNEQRLTALVTPATKALDGDYMVSLRASGDGVSQSADYRVTVMTFMIWGAAGIGVIALALLALVGAVGRYGWR